jgi:uncharacterized tellurite resistance protein B-like protein
MSPQEWYYQHAGQEHGPVSPRGLVDLANRQVITPDSLVRLGGDEKWRKASRVRGLFDESPKMQPTDTATTSQSVLPQRHWKVRRHGKIQGPFSAEQIQVFIERERLRQTDEIREVGKDVWNLISQWKEIVREELPIPSSLNRDESSVAKTSPTPASKSLVRFLCPHCQSKLRAPSAYCGKSVKCPACAKRVVIPTLPPTHSHEVPASRSKTEPAKSDRAASVHVTGRIADFRPPRDRVEFFGVGRRVDLGRGLLESPLIYATGAQMASCHEASLVELPLAVSLGNNDEVERLPYWPTYHDATPRQRGKYLEWLYGGRSDPSVELGYVFIYFYGLETRIIVDHLDHDPVIAELLRLLSVYGSKSRSFYNYGTSLLWLAAALHASSGSLTASTIHSLVNATPKWSPTTRRYMRAVAAEVGLTVFPPVFRAELLLPEEGLPNSTVARRHPEKLQELYLKRMETSFPGGFVSKIGPRPGTIEYRPASGTLPQRSVHWIQSKKWPNLCFERSQLKKAFSIWTECLDELREFDRVSRGEPVGCLTAEMYQSLPEELRTGDHPEWSAWEKLLESNDEPEDSSHPWKVIGGSDLAQIKNIPYRATLTKRQCEEILTTASFLGLSIEPDARRGGKAYGWDQPLAIFRQDGDPPSDIEWHAFQSAVAFLELGLQVALVDDDATMEELHRITRHLERNFSLSVDLQKRLDARGYLVREFGLSDKTVEKTVRERLTRAQRECVADFLIDVATADGIVTKQEDRLLRKLCKSLAVAETYLDASLAAALPEDVSDEISVEQVIADVQELDQEDGELIAASAEPDVPSFDIERLRRTRAETIRVQQILAEALAEDSDEEVSVALLDSPIATGEASLGPLINEALTSRKSTDDSDWTSLDERFRQPCRELLQRGEWSRSEFQQLARTYGLMPGSLMESVNEWSVDRWGDWLLEEMDEVIVLNQELSRKLK